MSKMASLTWQEIFKVSEALKFPADKIAALIRKESDGDKWALRFEPKWKYAYDTEKFAKACRISEPTERTCQMISWGLTQVMGTVAREMGFKEDLAGLLDVETNLTYGVKYFQKKIKKYGDNDSAIASFNSGSPQIVNGKFTNQKYVDEYKIFLKEARDYLKARGAA